MKTKSLIPSYDEVNDVFVCRFEDKKGYAADYDIADGVFLSVDKNRLPASLYVSDASDVFDISKQTLTEADVKIAIGCNKSFLHFTMFIEDSKICSYTCKNKYGIPNINFLMDSNH